MGGDRITEHVDEDKALDLQNAWHKETKMKYHGVLDMIAFFWEKGYEEGKKNAGNDAL
jgi:hypothetical protein